jgi:hypothetical protein
MRKHNLLSELNINTGKESFPDGRTNFLIKKHKEDTRLFQKLIETKPTENIIQSFLEEHPIVLLHAMLDGFYPVASTRSALFAKVTLGSQHEVDFAYCNWNSGGNWWTFIELERSDVQMFTKAGDPSKYLTHAIRQVTDWQTWLNDNYEYAKSEMQKYFEENTREFTYADHFRRPCNMIIVISRRANLSPETNRRRMQICSDNPRLEIMTYDRLFDDYWLDKEEEVDSARDKMRNIREII